jgi:hypothetical protein
VVALIASAAHAQVNIPVVGQPSPFYGAAGKDVRIEASASPTEITLDESIIYTLRIRNLVNAADVERPDLNAITDFERDFQIEDEPTTETEPAGTRIFKYQLRPRTLRIKAIPSLVFPYYDPNLPQPADRPEFPFRKVRTESIAIRVRKEAPPPLPAEPLDVPAFAETLPQHSMEMPRWVWWFAAVVPPIVAFGWCLAWRVMNPAGARLVRRRRSRAARAALRTLQLLGRRRSPEAGAIVGCVATYLAEHYDLPGIFRTPGDLSRRLLEAGASPETIADCEAFLREADAVRFSPTPAGSVDALIADAERLVRHQEGEA